MNTQLINTALVWERALQAREEKRGLLCFSDEHAHLENNSAIQPASISRLAAWFSKFSKPALDEPAAFTPEQCGKTQTA
jgi:hypothetical protein